VQAWRNVTSKPHKSAEMCCPTQHTSTRMQCMARLANETDSLSLFTIPFFWVYNWSPYWATTLLRRIRFSLTIFFGPWCCSGMLLQYTFKGFFYRVSAQAWVKCFHICRYNAEHQFLRPSFSGFGKAVFPTEQVSTVLTAVLTKFIWPVFAKGFSITALTGFCTNSFFVQGALKGCSINSRNARMREVSG